MITEKNNYQKYDNHVQFTEETLKKLNCDMNFWLLGIEIKGSGTCADDSRQ